MASYPLRALFNLEHAPSLEGVKASGSTKSNRQKDAGGFVSKAPSNASLDALPIGNGAHYQGPAVPKPLAKLDTNYARVTDEPYSWSPPDEWLTEPPTAHSRREPLEEGTYEPQTSTRAPTPDELESSRQPDPGPSNATDIVQKWNDPPINRWRVLSTCIFAVGNGMNDSAPGALLPYMEKYYHIGYAIVSLIFITNAIGFILAAFFVHVLDNKLGRAKTLMLTDIANMGAYILMGFAPPFPVFVIGYFIAGLAQATNLALNNVWVSNLANSTPILGWFHGAYGVGGLIAPIIATSLINQGVFFARYYFIQLGLRVVSLGVAGWAFWNFEKELAARSSTLLTSLERSTSRQAQRPSTTETPEQSNGEEVTASPSKLAQLTHSLKNRTTLIGALFIFAYQGAEVSISGWAISFLINYRNGSPAKVGYVTAGFWGGIAVGRVLLSYPAQRIGEKIFTYGLVVGSIGFQLLVWFLPNVIGDAVGIALLGLLLGPIWPCCAALFTRLLPRNLQNTAMAFISGAGSSGGAVAPFLTGLIAQSSGTWVLHPICIALFVAMIGFLAALPKVQKRRE